jgi:[ribosomal protein S5]-alanine N-acetyltransferase
MAHDDLPELHTGHLVVRHVRPGMEDAMVAFLSANQAGHFDRWEPPATAAILTVAFWKGKLLRDVDEFHRDIAVRFVMQPRADDTRIIGCFNYTQVSRGAFQACYLGYKVDRAFEGRGLMREALQAGNEYMFSRRRIHRIMANHIPENERSARLLARLGFVREGTARDYLFINGAWRDHVLNSLAHPAYDPAWITPLGTAPPG